jgi:ketosteroid isomerase-like protein
VSEQPAEITHQRILESSMSGDLAPYLSLFADDAVVMPNNDTTLFGKEELKAFWQEYFEFFRVISSTETEREVTVVGDQAFERLGFSVTIVPKQRGAKIRDDIRSLILWKRDVNGNWKISRHIWNSVKPVGAGTNRYMLHLTETKGRPGSSTR